jgi:hypothetical protein
MAYQYTITGQPPTDLSLAAVAQKMIDNMNAQ